MTVAAKKTLLITGAEGQLGQCFQYILKKDTTYQVHFVSKAQCDLTDAVKTQRVITAVQPDIVINCAGYTQVDAAEQNTEQAAAVNVTALKNLMLAAEATPFFLLHFSTDYVFEGTQKTPYSETDQINPLNVYGETKRRGEELLFKAATPHCCIRTSWVFSPFGKNFLNTIIQKLEAQSPLRVVEDQFARPTSGLDLARAVIQLLETPHASQYRLYHFANTGSTSWYGFAKEIAVQIGSNTPIYPIAANEIQQAAPRPKYSVLSTDRMEKLGNFPLRLWQEALKECITITNEKRY